MTEIVENDVYINSRIRSLPAQKKKVAHIQKSQTQFQVANKSSLVKNTDYLDMFKVHPFLNLLHSSLMQRMISEHLLN